MYDDEQWLLGEVHRATEIVVELLGGDAGLARLDSPVADEPVTLFVGPVDVDESIDVEAVADRWASALHVPLQDGAARSGRIVVLSGTPDAWELDPGCAEELGRWLAGELARREASRRATPPTEEEVSEALSDVGTSEQLRRAVESWARPVLCFDRDSLRFLVVNAAARARYGYDDAEFSEMTPFDLRPPDDAASLGAGIREGVGGGAQRYWNGRATAHWDRHRSLFPVRLTLVNLDLDGGATEVRVAVVTEQPEEPPPETTLDPLTRLATRAGLLIRLGQWMEQGLPVAVVMLDIDHFKSVNDVAGHQRGDELLVAAAARMSEALPDGAVLCRHGGDDFTAAVPRLAPDGGVDLAERMCSGLEPPFHLAGGEFRVTASAGVAVSEPGDTVADVLNGADAALHEAKRGGRNRVRVVDSGTRDEHRRRSRIERELALALARDELVLHYQPIFSLDGSRATRVGAEALVRWQHPDDGLLGPGAFLDVAEASGLMGPLGRWVLGRAAHDLSTLRARGSRLSVNVNCSATQLTPSLVDDVAEVLEVHGLDADDLLLELTESVVADDAAVALEVIRELRDLGVRSALDDFGTGHSTLARLRELPVASLKLDRSFVAGAADQGGESLLRAVVALAGAVELPVVAEGVETPEELRLVRDLGCSFVQGFLVGRPSPLEQLLLAPEVVEVG